MTTEIDSELLLYKVKVRTIASDTAAMLKQVWMSTNRFQPQPLPTVATLLLSNQMGYFIRLVLSQSVNDLVSTLVCLSAFDTIKQTKKGSCQLIVKNLKRNLNRRNLVELSRVLK